MEDSDIVSLYWERSEAAVQETAKKYGPYLSKIAYNILADRQDGQECVNDTYWKAWSSMPPHRPEILSAYLGKITRQLSIDALRKRERQKRRGTEYDLSLDELAECVSGRDTAEQQAELHLLAGAVSAYLRTLSPEARNVFVGRYYFMDSLRDIAACHAMSEARVKSLLYRTRQGLKAYLEKEGFEL